jgi:hypothetical protein
MAVQRCTLPQFRSSLLQLCARLEHTRGLHEMFTSVTGSLTSVSGSWSAFLSSEATSAMMRRQLEEPTCAMVLNIFLNIVQYCSRGGYQERKKARVFSPISRFRFAFRLQWTGSSILIYSHWSEPWNDGLNLVKFYHNILFICILEKKCIVKKTKKVYYHLWMEIVRHKGLVSWT